MEPDTDSTNPNQPVQTEPAADYIEVAVPPSPLDSPPELLQPPLSKAANKGKLMIVVLIFLIALVAAAGVAAYIVRDSQAKAQKSDDAARIKTLEDKITELEKMSSNLDKSDSNILILQQKQRDVQRKNDIARISTQITLFSSNNRGAIPSDLTKALTSASGGESFVQSYLGGDSLSDAGPDYIDPLSLKSYIFIAPLLSVDTEPNLELGQIAYQPQAQCDKDTVGKLTVGTTRSYALRTRLESQTDLYCTDVR